MSYRVFHFGGDDCHRVRVLRSAGYEVRESACIEQLVLDLRNRQPVDLVIVSVHSQREAEEAAELVRQHCPAPLVLFSGYRKRLDEAKFDRVFSAFVGPQVWLSETAALIEDGRAGRPTAAFLSYGSEEIEPDKGNLERSGSITSSRIIPFSSAKGRESAFVKNDAPSLADPKRRRCNVATTKSEGDS